MKELEFPFDSGLILKNKKKIKRELLEKSSGLVKKKIAVLCGSTANNVAAALELFLLDCGIECEFYLSEYDRCYEEAVFDNPELEAFAPDIVYIHTTNRNLREYAFDPTAADAQVNEALDAEYSRYETMWRSIRERYSCPIIQNNFEKPSYRLMGNRDIWDIHGAGRFIGLLNEKIYAYARENEDFFVNDLDYISSCKGLDSWFDDSAWYMYKYAFDPKYAADVAFSVSNIVKSIFGKNKKMLALDLDNTLWGGVIGDDGIDNIKIGEETAEGEVYKAFQKYLSEYKKLGIILGVCSKNDYENAIEGLGHPDGILRPDDFVSIKANWDSKDRNITQMANEIGILPESIVFVDDNPAEREIVRMQCGCRSPELTEPESYIRTIDRSGFFEVTYFSSADIKRNEMYKANAQRRKQQAAFESYDDYLASLEMSAKIDSFRPGDIVRVTSLTNKSNQFNLTTKRYTREEIEAAAADSGCITLCGRLTDKFGDNGIVSVVIGRINGEELDIELWLMSCRVLKRGMEYAMLDTLVSRVKDRNIKKINGYYYPTKKNGMVKELYGDFGFTKIKSDESETVWELCLDDYSPKKFFIDVKENSDE